MPALDYYALLEIPINASPDQIKQAYRRLVRLYHPDLHKGTRDIHIKQLNEAYGVLSDPAKRTVYDIARLEGTRQKIMGEATQMQQSMTWREGILGFVRELKKELRKA